MQMLLIKLLIFSGILTTTVISSILILSALVHDEWKVSIPKTREQLKMMKGSENLWISCETNMNGREECKNLGFKACSAPARLTIKRGFLVLSCILTITSAVLMVSDITLCKPKYIIHMAAGAITLLSGVLCIGTAVWYMNEINQETADKKAAEEEAAKGPRPPVLYYTNGGGIAVSMAAGAMCFVAAGLRMGYGIYQGNALKELKWW